MKRQGLTTAEVRQRMADGRQNTMQANTERSYGDIVSANVFTYFNMLNVLLAGLVLLSGEYKNMLFMGVVISNTVIAIYQECKAKRILDGLKLLNQPKVTVLRDGKLQAVEVSELVMDDWMQISSGEQIVADAVMESGYLEVNESNITGESLTIIKHEQDMLTSGSYATAGKALCRVIHINEENTIQTMLKEVKRSKRQPSMLRDTLDWIIKTVSFLILPIGVLLFAKQYWISHLVKTDALLQTVAAMVGMIPEGLILLTSVALSVGTYKIAKEQTLVQEMYCLETLARVDMLCLDKTGTLTSGHLRVKEIVSLKSGVEIGDILGNMIADLQDENQTAMAIKTACTVVKRRKAVYTLPFSSARKYSAVTYEDGIYALGALEFLHARPDEALRERLAAYTASQNRVLVVVHHPQVREQLPDATEIIGYVVLADVIRPTARPTLDYFDRQKVSVRIISGDDVRTVRSIAQTAGVHHAELALDASTLSDEELQQAVLTHTVFGRVTPKQKRLMIRSLKQAGYTTAMVGDGVNDVMALKEADCSIAMAEGSQAAKDIANIVLLDNDFSHMPSIVDEGRRVINNIQRTATLFLTKTTFSALLAILTVFAIKAYPFYPIQLTLMSTLLIGFPSFILSLEPNYEMVRGNFLANVLSKAIPAGVSVVSAISLLQLLALWLPMEAEAMSTMSVCVTIAILGYVLITISLPLNGRRLLLLGTVVGGFLLAFVVVPELFEIHHLSVLQTGITGILAVVAVLLLRTLDRMRLSERLARFIQARAAGIQ